MSSSFHGVREILRRAAAADAVAFRFTAPDGSDAVVSYRDFADDVFALGSALCDLGLSSAHIAQIGANSYRWITVYLASLAGCGAFVPVDPASEEDELIRILQHSDSEAVFFTPPQEKMLRRRRAELPRIHFFICVEPWGAPAFAEDDCFLSYISLLQRGRGLVAAGDGRFAALDPDPDEMRMLVYTSGTMGRVKGVMLSERNILAGVRDGMAMTRLYGRSLSVLPYHHTYEAVCGLLSALIAQSEICLCGSIRLLPACMKKYKPEHMFIVPALAEDLHRRLWAIVRRQGKEAALRRLIRTSEAMRARGIDMRWQMFAPVRQAFGGELKKLICGGAPLRAETGEFFDRIGITLVNGYGITECAPLVAVNGDADNDPRTVGHVLPCLEIRIADPCEEGEGEICVRGENVMLGYYKDDALTAQVMSVDGWFATGDLGRLTEDGRLVITGRRTNMIVLQSGKNVYPEELEARIAAIPYTAGSIVYAVRDEYGGETQLHAEVCVPPERAAEYGIENPAAALKGEIAAICASLPPHKRIAKVILRSDRFAETSSGKIKREVE